MSDTFRERVARSFPIARWLFSYRREWLRHDLIAGITVAVVILPKAMAFAVVAGLPIEIGLYTALAATLAYPLFGTSRPLSVTTASAMAMFTATGIALMSTRNPAIDPRTVAATLALMVAGVLLGAWLLRLGFLANFMSEPVLVGFQAAVGITIIASQVSVVLGVHGHDSTLIGVIRELPALIADAHLLTVAIAVTGIVALVLLPKVAPKLPAPLVWVGVSLLASGWFRLSAEGVKLVGKVPSSLPPLSIPDLSFAASLVPIALGIALVSFVESAATARAFCRSEDPPIDANRELLAMAAANAASAVMGGMAACGVPSATGVADEAGARSQLAQWVSAVAIAVTLLYFSGPMGLLPKPALAAVIIVASAVLIKPRKFLAIARVRRMELAWALITLTCGVFLNLLYGVLIAIGISILSLIYLASRPPVYALVYDREKRQFRPAADAEPLEVMPGVLMLRIEGRLMFANADNVAEKLRTIIGSSTPRVIVLECSGVPDIEYTALDALAHAEKNLRARGIGLLLAGVNRDVRTLIDRSPLGEALGADRILPDAYAVFDRWAGIEGQPGAQLEPGGRLTPIPHLAAVVR
jgi:SulP family sulfate permease